MNIEELRNQIKELNQKLQKELDDQNKEKILNLEWTKDCEAKLEIPTFVVAGMPKYEIYLRNAPEYHGSLCIYESLNRKKQVFYSNHYSGAKIQFNSEEALIEFLNKVKFKKFEFDEKLLNLLLKIKESQSEK